MLSALRVVTRIRTVEIRGILRYFNVQHHNFTFIPQTRVCGTYKQQWSEVYTGQTKENTRIGDIAERDSDGMTTVNIKRVWLSLNVCDHCSCYIVYNNRSKKSYTPKTKMR